MDSNEDMAIYSEGGSERKRINLATMFVALIDKDFINDPDAIYDCLIASKKGKPMFAIMHNTVKMPRQIRKIKWNAISICSDQIDIKTNGKELTKQLNILNDKWNEKDARQIQKTT